MLGKEFLDYLHTLGENHNNSIDTAHGIATAADIEYQLDDLFDQIQTISLAKPQKALSIAGGLEKLLQIQNANADVLGKSAWLVGWSANQCTNPNIALPAIERAEKIFKSLEKDNWLAACLWQKNALPWTKANVSKTAKDLDEALTKLIEIGFKQYILPCRLSLINALLMIGNFEKALQHIELGKKEANTQLSLGRLALFEANHLLRVNQFDQALEKLNPLISLFEQLDAPRDIAQVTYQKGLIYFISGKDYSLAIYFLEKAIRIFDELSMELWCAACINTLGQPQMMQGDSSKAQQSFENARNIFRHYGILGLQADNFNDSGLLALQSGKPNVAIKLFSHAKQLYQQLGLKLLEQIASSNLGNALAIKGKYQDALKLLENASDELKKLQNGRRAAGIEFYLANIWHNLHQDKTALEHLEIAETLFEYAQQPSLVAWIEIYRVEILIKMQEYNEAFEHLTKINLADCTIKQKGLVHRLFAIIHFHNHNYEEAKTETQKALNIFIDSEMRFEQAECMLILGDIHKVNLEFVKARSSYLQAGGLNQKLIPDIGVLVQERLGLLADIQSQKKIAFNHYYNAYQIVIQTRLNLWQPTLSAGWMTGKSNFIDRAIKLSLKYGKAQEWITLIDGSKAITLNNSILTKKYNKNSESTKLSSLRQDITYLQHQLRASITSNLWQQGKPEIIQLRKKLQNKIQEYTYLSAKQKRKSNNPTTIQTDFNLEEFKRLANQEYSDGWVALDYYYSQDFITIILLSPKQIKTFKTNISPQEKLALDTCQRQTTKPKDLITLSNLLFPPEITKLLSKNLVLLISPHRILHNVPWPILLNQNSNRYLVETCIPLLTPSLSTSLILLSQPISKKKINGLIIGISNHPHYAPLPQVEPEIHSIAKLSNSIVLQDSQANWDNIKQTIAAENFQYLHLATHITHDPWSGILSNIAFYDQDVWADQINVLTPIPELVSLSACNGMKSQILEGDEQISLVSSLLSAGTKTIIGSQKPIEDKLAKEIMTIFYTNYLQGIPANHSLAISLRQAISKNTSPFELGGIICVGRG